MQVDRGTGWTEDDFLDISKAVAIIADQIMEDSTGWFGEECANDLVVTVLGINGEAGEVADIVKKGLRGSIDPSDLRVTAHLCEELVDVFIYVLMAARILNFDIVKGYMEKREYNHRRFSNEGRTDQSSLASSVGKQQQSSLGSAAFVGESELPC